MLNEELNIEPISNEPKVDHNVEDFFNKNCPLFTEKQQDISKSKMISHYVDNEEEDLCNFDVPGGCANNIFQRSYWHTSE